MKSLSISEAALPPMRVLSNRLHLPSHLAVPDGDQGVYIQKADTPGLIKIDTCIGRRMDLHCTGVGKILLAFGPSELAGRFLAKPVYIRYTRNTITSPRQIPNVGSIEPADLFGLRLNTEAWWRRREADCGPLSRAPAHLGTGRQAPPRRRAGMQTAGGRINGVWHGYCGRSSPMAVGTPTRSSPISKAAFPISVTIGSPPPHQLGLARVALRPGFTRRGRCGEVSWC